MAETSPASEVATVWIWAQEADPAPWISLSPSLNEMLRQKWDRCLQEQKS